MKQKIFNLTEASLSIVYDTIAHTPHDNSYQVVIRPAKDKRNIAQNSLYWAWMKGLEGETGYRSEEMHNRFSRTYLPRIYMESAENQNQLDWTALYDVIKEDGTPLMIERALDTVSTTWLTVSQFSEYLKLIEQFCQSKSLMLPIDPELYKEAMH